ncbi:hypothetical protein BGZ49_004895 [Haplosporangium sp. Z 27]|nr:hypothetical protein BGZ49_004895 [Haplosporangium sp. Z 27]
MTITHQKQQRSVRWLSKALLSVALMATSAQAACISLANSKACPKYSSFFVDTSVSKTVLDYNINMPSFTTVQEFDNAVYNATGFYTVSDCTGYNKTVRIPYQNTVLCTIATLDSASSSCKGQPTNVNADLCASSCTLYQQGLSAMINSHCPKVADAVSSLSIVTTICSRKDTNSWPGLQDTSSSCVNALDNEAAFCGLGSLADKCTYCKTNSTASCCKTSPICSTTTTSATPVATFITQTGTTPTASPTGGAGDGSSSTGTSKNLGAIVGGSIGGVVVIAAFLIICMRKAKKAEVPQGSALARQASNASSRYKISNPKLQEEGFVAVAPIPMTALPPISSDSSSFGLSNAVAGAAVGAGAGAAAGRNNAQGKLSYCQALYPYQASMADELDLTPGDIVNVQKVFDDGWAVGINMNTSKEGAFPVVCVMFVDESALDDDDFEDVNMSMPPMTLREEDQEGRRSPSGRNSPRSSLPSRSSSPVHLPRRNSSIRDSTVVIPGTNPATSSPLAGNNNGGTGRMTPPVIRDTMMSDASSVRW